MDNKSEYGSVEGKLAKKEKNPSSNPKAPYGFVYVEGFKNKITVWKEVEFNKLIEGGEYKLVYKYSFREFNGRTYHTYSLNDIVDNTITADSKSITFSTEDYNKLAEEFGPNKKLKKGEETKINFKMLGHTIVYKEDVEDIAMPRDVFLYLINLKNIVENYFDEDLVYIPEDEEDEKLMESGADE